MKKIAVFFPGIGYSTERPLLYYTKKMLIGYGYEIVELDYATRIDAGITKEIRDNLLNPQTVKNVVLKYVGEAIRFLEDQLEKGSCIKKQSTAKGAVCFEGYDRVIFVSKSIGSVVDTVFCSKYGIKAEHIFYTPIEQAFQLMKNIDGLAFSGLADPVAKADNIREICGHHNIEFYSVSGGNHSLETGNVQADIKNLSWIISNVDDYVTGLDKTVYDYEVETRGGGLEKLSDHRGRVLLIVNTATGCGFTPQYRALEELYERYSKDGFEILDFPCNQFMNQAPGTSEEIYSFCTSRYAISFPQYAKIHVNGDGQSKLFEYLKSRKGFTGFDTSTQDGRFLDRKLKETDPDYANNSDIKWNFTKFLVDRRGHVVERYEPTTDISVIEGDVRRCLDD